MFYSAAPLLKRLMTKRGQRWRHSLHAAGYFGPADVIFRYATTPKETMTLELFRTLEPVLSGRPVSRASNQT